jgi:hypothetical protein
LFAREDDEALSGSFAFWLLFRHLYRLWKREGHCWAWIEDIAKCRQVLTVGSWRRVSFEALPQARAKWVFVIVVKGGVGRLDRGWRQAIAVSVRLEDLAIDRVSAVGARACREILVDSI